MRVRQVIPIVVVALLGVAAVWLGLMYARTPLHAVSLDASPSESLELPTTRPSPALPPEPPSNNADNVPAAPEVATPAGSTSGYPNTTEGLKRFFRDMLDASVRKDGRKLLAMSRSLYLPDPDAWFKRVFGEKNAPSLIEEYKVHMKPTDPTKLAFDYSLATAFMNLRDPEILTVTATKVEDTDDPNIKALQRVAMDLMQYPERLYYVRVYRPNTSAKLEIYSLVYVDGGFRIVGQMRAARDIKPPEHPQDK